MLVANLDLPKESGDVLLSKAKRDYPNSLRFLIHNPSDVGSLQKGTGLPHLYLETPITADELARSINYVYKTQLRIRRKEVVEIVCDTKQLHVNTQPMQELLKTAEDPNCHIEDLAPVIMQHPTAVATILQVANTRLSRSGRTHRNHRGSPTDARDGLRPQSSHHRAR